MKRRSKAHIIRKKRGLWRRCRQDFGELARRYRPLIDRYTFALERVAPWTARTWRKPKGRRHGRSQ